VSRSPGTGAAGAGVLLISTILVCAAVGLGLGALIGAPVPFLLIGGGAGVVVGFWNVYSRFKNI
jgi:Putative F0F1-ATPase subunit Ca2+/Mg2+ transporter